MPIFLDHHQGVQPTSQRTQDMIGIKAGLKADRTGTRMINGYYTTSQSWCLTEAPSAKAVRDFHEARGIKLASSDVTEVHALV